MTTKYNEYKNSADKLLAAAQAMSQTRERPNGPGVLELPALLAKLQAAAEDLAAVKTVHETEAAGEVGRVVADHNELVSRLGEVAAKSAMRAIRNGERAGLDQNRGQFVAMVSGVLKDIPAEQRWDEAKAFLVEYKDGAYGASARGR